MRGIALLAAVTLPAQTLGQGPQLTTSCQWSTSQGSWDLSPLTLPSSTYTTTDARDGSLSYYYNFCSAFSALPRGSAPVHPPAPSPAPPSLPSFAHARTHSHTHPRRGGPGRDLWLLPRPQEAGRGLCLQHAPPGSDCAAHRLAVRRLHQAHQPARRPHVHQ